MPCLINELWDYTQKKDPPLTEFDKYHNYAYIGPSDPNLTLKKFLFATMGEVRLRYANMFAKIAL